MSDWELTQKNKSSSDWEVSHPSQTKENESFLGSAVKAPFRIGNDILSALGKGLLATPGYAEKAKTEIPGLFNLLTKHPLRALAQGAAGFTELGHETLNLPKNISDYASNRLHLLPKYISDKIPYQQDISQEINAAFGEPKYPGESLIRGTARNLPAIVGVAKGVSQLSKIGNPYSSKNIVNEVINTKNKVKEKYSNIYNSIWDDAESSGLGNLNHLTPQIDIETIRKYSPTKDIVGLEEFINNPTLKNAHNAKSDLLSIQRKLDKLTTKRTAERRQYDAISNAIENIQKDMFKASNGNVDSDLLNKYLKTQKGYREEVTPYTTNKDIRAYENKELSAKELLPKLSHGKFAAQRGKSHPRIKTRENLINTAIKLGLGGGAIGGGKTLYDYLMGNKEY